MQTYVNTGPNGIYTRAIVHTPDNSDNKFAGAGMIATIWNVDAQGQQNSACRMKIQKGSDKLQVGWRVDPTLYGDNNPRLFIHFQAGNTQCFNTLCHGFIIVNSDIHLDQVLTPVSQRRGKQFAITAYITRDLINGNWWLLLGTDQTAVGFWPPRIFRELSNDFATNVEWGGVTYTPPGVSFTPMGTGFWPHIPDPTLDAYCRGLIVLDDKGEGTNANDTPQLLDNEFLYRIIEESHIVYYGGPEDPDGDTHR
ncbi:uncharacterized protein LOC129892911 [Solanum dulcamara]|uniref:uncharacterized protein LOC129892911 n=1 Tax=Solanum dulcamara TaxID=45834 RepID=UPI002486A350|nr:uncharacterized protein LOC129892911 [Solanum dulcamara]